ncbi:anaphase-promoting complex subunit 8-like [Lycorma delicatula]|uniref:anaphase-promoting complex subunit 8-like n=1 Tax=Lycorma delicatula TaxID=130591 RepID=UPI003F50EF04
MLSNIFKSCYCRLVFIFAAIYYCNMNEDLRNLDLKEVKLSIQKAIVECSRRGLLHGTKWLAELNFSLKDVVIDSSEIPLSNIISSDLDNDIYLKAKCYFDLKEYDRCAYHTEKNENGYCKFLHLYSRYLSVERKKIDNLTDLNYGTDPQLNSQLQSLYSELRSSHLAGRLDGFCLYLYGMVLKRLDLHTAAIQVLVEAVHKEPLHWSAWVELATLITDRAKLTSLTLPDHWIKQFFIAHTYLEQQLNEEALEIYNDIQNQGFASSTYLLAQAAIAYHNKREVTAAITTFQHLRKLDPYRLDNLDTLSNLLYVKEMKVELAYLAHHASEIDKYKVETCCIIGNYYSLRGEHHKAVLYFERALRLNPLYLSAWTLMGHEFMEMKNTNAAIQSYRQAIEVNRRDYRAWYGLGQTYEILKMPFYCLYYYKQAQVLRPNDSRMLIALGETYEKLEKIQEALKCYYKARSVGDIEGTALLKLAKLYDKVTEVEQAATAYTEYVKENDDIPTADNKQELCYAYKYLANYHLKRNQLDLAYQYAEKCLGYEETKEEGKALLRTIASKRGQDDGEMQVEDSGGHPNPPHRIRPDLNQVTPVNLTFTPPDGS